MCQPGAAPDKQGHLGGSSEWGCWVSNSGDQVVAEPGLGISFPWQRPASSTAL